MSIMEDSTMDLISAAETGSGTIGMADSTMDLISAAETGSGASGMAGIADSTMDLISSAETWGWGAGADFATASWTMLRICASSRAGSASDAQASVAMPANASSRPIIIVYLATFMSCPPIHVGFCRILLEPS